MHKAFGWLTKLIFPVVDAVYRKRMAFLAQTLVEGLDLLAEADELCNVAGDKALFDEHDQRRKLIRAKLRNKAAQLQPLVKKHISYVLREVSAVNVRDKYYDERGA